MYRPPHEAEHGVVFQFEGVFGVKHEHIEPHDRHAVDVPLDGIHCVHAAPGFVQHNAQFFKARGFLDEKFILFPGGFDKEPQSPEEVALFLVNDGALPVFQGDLNPVSFGNGHFDAVGAVFELQQLLQVVHAEGQLLVQIFPCKQHVRSPLHNH